jgi:hypothetical protein
MFNSTGTTKTELGARAQILANVEHQFSVGCNVSQAVGVTVGTRTIAKAGTPISMNLQSTNTAAVLATGAVAMTGVLLHDVDVTNGNNNGTCLIFGFVNLNRLDTEVQTLVTAAAGNANASKLVTFLKV